MDDTWQNAVDLIRNGWEGRQVLVIGDVMLDKYILGTVDRISPEAPVPVVHGCRSTHCPGGAANVAMNVVGLGARAIIMGFVGNDEDANTLDRDLRAAGITVSLISVPDFPTTSKLRILSNHQQMLRVDFEKPGGHPASAYEKLISQVREVIPSCSAVVLSDYAKGVLSDAVCAAIINDARMLGIPVLVDPKSPSFEKYRNATTICPNLQEFERAAGVSSKNVEKELLEAGDRLVKHFGLDFLTVTLGEKGIAVVRNGALRRASAVAKQVFDVSGAGDTVIATLSLCLACGGEIESAIELANVAAGIVISKVGTVPIDRNELIGALSQDIASRADGKIVMRDRLRAQIMAWRAASQRIVFTNGCFDVIHVGHIDLLECARRQGDRLVVAINSDDSVTKLKGPERPVVGERQRARVLAALSAVDAVVVFDEDTPLELLREIRPDVLVKGDDYTEAEIVGSQDVRSWGGRVCLVPRFERVSSSELIAKSAVRSE